MEKRFGFEKNVLALVHLEDKSPLMRRSRRFDGVDGLGVTRFSDFVTKFGGISKKYLVTISLNLATISDFVTKI